MRTKTRNWTAVAAFQRSGAGKHKNKARRGSGKGSGKAARHAKHKGRQQW
jgi:hypothetical protein